MRIAFVTPRFHPVVGGIEESTLRLAQGLTARGHPVTIHTLREPSTLAAEEPLGALRIRRYPAARRAGYYTTTFHPDLAGDLVHLHAYGHHTNDWVIRRHLGRVPIVLSTHHGARFPKGLLGLAYHPLYNILRGFPDLRRIDALLTPTALDADYFADHGVAEERIHVLPSAAEPAAFLPHAPWLPPGVRKPPLLFLGRLHREKGVQDLLRAYQFARPDLPLLFAGRDEGEAASLARAAAPGLDVHVLTDFATEQKWGLLAACRALVLPSHHEGQGIVVAEAWAARKPVIATDAGALPGVVENHVDGLLVPKRDAESLGAALVRIATDDRLAKRLGEAGRRKAEERYQWPRILDKLEAVYAQAVAGRATS